VPQAGGGGARARVGNLRLHAARRCGRVGARILPGAQCARTRFPWVVGGSRKKRREQKRGGRAAAVTRVNFPLFSTHARHTPGTGGGPHTSLASSAHTRTHAHTHTHCARRRVCVAACVASPRRQRGGSLGSAAFRRASKKMLTHAALPLPPSGAPHALSLPPHTPSPAMGRGGSVTGVQGRDIAAAMGSMSRELKETGSEWRRLSSSRSGNWVSPGRARSPPGPSGGGRAANAAKAERPHNPSRRLPGLGCCPSKGCAGLGGAHSACVQGSSGVPPARSLSAHPPTHPPSPSLSTHTPSRNPGRRRPGRQGRLPLCRRPGTQTGGCATAGPPGGE